MKPTDQVIAEAVDATFMQRGFNARRHAEAVISALEAEGYVIAPALGGVAEGWRLVPIEPTEAMLEAALDVSGQRVAPFTAERESGVATECDLSEQDAADINEQLKAAHCDVYGAMLEASPAPSIIADKGT